MAYQANLHIVATQVNSQELENYLHEHIPLTKAMEISVTAASWDGVTVTAPLAANINHRDTAFGGSISAIAIVAAWSLLHIRLGELGIRCRLVIQRNTVDYERPIGEAFQASSQIDDNLSWEKFIAGLHRRRRARITVTAKLICAGAVAAQFSGDFVALESAF